MGANYGMRPSEAIDWIPQKIHGKVYNEIRKLVAKNRDLIVNINDKIDSFDLVSGVKGWIYEEMYIRAHQKEGGVVWIERAWSLRYMYGRKQMCCELL